MDDIIKKLSDIENEAVKILEDANSQKVKLSEKIEQITHAWDLEKEQEVQNKLKELQAKIQHDIREKLNRQEEWFRSELQALELNYETNKDRYLDFLFQRIIKD